MTILNNAQGGENIDIKVDKSLAVIEWDKSRVITWAKIYAQKYQGLVMTDENVDGIKAVCADLNSKINRLDEIRLAQGREFKTPLDKFYAEIEEVKKVLADVREPLWTDVKKFNERRRNEKAAEAQTVITSMVAEAGMRPNFAEQIKVEDAWTVVNVTPTMLKAKVRERVASVMQLQHAEDQANEMKKQRSEMAGMMCRLQSEAAGLAVPIEEKDIYGIDNLTLSDLPAAITTAVTRRKESETAAIERAERQKIEAQEREARRIADAETNIIRQAEIDAAREAIARVEAQEFAVKEAEELPFAPPAPPVEKQYKLNLSVFGTENEITTFLSIIEANGYNYATGKMEEVK